MHFLIYVHFRHRLEIPPQHDDVRLGLIYGLVNSVVILGTVLEIKMHTEDDDTMHFLVQ